MTMSNDDDLPRSGNNAASSGSSGPGLKLILFVALAAVGVIFVLQNRERKSVDFLVFEINSRQWVNIAVAILLGVVLDRLFLSWWRRRKANSKKND